MSNSGGDTGGGEWGTSSSGSSGGSSSSGMIEPGKCAECLPPAPTSWQYVHIRDTDFGQSTDTCADGSTPQRFFATPSEPGCTPCSCNVQGTCASSLTCYTNIGCAGLNGKIDYATLSGCVPFVPGIPVTSCEFATGGKLAAEPTCNANGGGLTRPDAFEKEYHVCAAQMNGQGCNGQSCIIEPANQYQNRTCLMSAGDMSCPAGYSQKMVAYTDYIDTRQCSSCSCDTNQIVCAGPTQATFWNNAQCTTGAKIIGSGSGCVNLIQTPTHINVTDLPTPTVPPIGCTGGQMTGEITAMGAMTICCD